LESLLPCLQGKNNLRGHSVATIAVKVPCRGGIYRKLDYFCLNSTLCADCFFFFMYPTYVCGFLVCALQTSSAIQIDVLIPDSSHTCRIHCCHTHMATMITRHFYPTYSCAAQAKGWLISTPPSSLTLIVGGSVWLQRQCCSRPGRPRIPLICWPTTSMHNSCCSKVWGKRQAEKRKVQEEGQKQRT